MLVYYFKLLCINQKNSAWIILLTPHHWKNNDNLDNTNSKHSLFLLIELVTQGLICPAYNHQIRIETTVFQHLMIWTFEVSNHVIMCLRVQRVVGLGHHLMCSVLLVVVDLLLLFSQPVARAKEYKSWLTRGPGNKTQKWTKSVTSS